MKKEIFIHEVDTLVQRDTILKTDTVFVRKERSFPKWEDKFLGYLGFSVTTSQDIHHVQYWESHESYYSTLENRTENQPNYSLGLFVHVIGKSLEYRGQTSWLLIRERLIANQESSNNSLQYLSFDASLGYPILKSKVFKLTAWGKIGVQKLLSQSGNYINPYNIDDISPDNNFFPTRSSQLTIGGRLTGAMPISSTWVGELSLFMDYWPYSITQVEHPVLFWKTFFGLQASIMRQSF